MNLYIFDENYHILCISKNIFPLYASRARWYLYRPPGHKVDVFGTDVMNSESVK